MRRFLYILGSLTLVVFVVAIVGFGLVAYKGNELDAESRAFVDSAVPAIAARWSKQELLDRATPELRENAKPARLQMMFEALSRLGRPVEYEGATGQATMTYIAGSGSTVSGSYTAKVKFEGGSAAFKIGLLRRDGHWMIHNFHVDPVGSSPAGGKGA
jgi:hypothetical protein